MYLKSIIQLDWNEINATCTYCNIYIDFLSDVQQTVTRLRGLVVFFRDFPLQYVRYCQVNLPSLL